ncbi:MAG TPA: alpha/beta hydrolase [Acidobacteriaceae bacterium]|jgi:pimeloyl-ACP methyl ester carboxylesterase|nr:alpha/beta hydrolase [Acidobacteriaceae bacterium]
MIVILGIPLALTALVLLILAAGILYQRIGGFFDRRRLLAPGRVIDTGDGRRLYLVEKGCGGPSVVFESGFGATSLNWMEIQDAVSEYVHTVAYDRCGLGWSSEPVSERTPRQIALELRGLLQAAGVPSPYVLVGHSFGGLVMQRYALDYPDEVAGLVLVDPMRTQEWPPINAGRSAVVKRAERLSGHGATLARFGMARLAARSHLCRSAKLSGFLVRLAGEQGEYLAKRLNTEIGKMPPQVRPSIAAHWSAPRFYRGFIAHLRSVADTVREMHHAEPIGDLPVVVLTPGSARPLSEQDMRKFGPLSRQVIAERSEHWVHLDEPHLVIRTVLDMVFGVAANEEATGNAVAVAMGAD